MSHADLEAEYQQLRVDAAIEALKSEWASPQVLGSYNLKTTGGGGGGGSSSNPRSSTGGMTHHGLSQSPRENFGGSGRKSRSSRSRSNSRARGQGLFVVDQAELQFYGDGANNRVNVPAMGLSPLPYDYQPEVLYTDEGEGMRSTEHADIDAFVDQHRDLTSRADIFGNRSKHISPPRPARDSRGYNSTFTPFDDITNGQYEQQYQQQERKEKAPSSKWINRGTVRASTPTRNNSDGGNRRVVTTTTEEGFNDNANSAHQRSAVTYRGGIPVEDRLLQAQQEYAARKIAAREEKERRENRHLSGSPSISARSKKLVEGKNRSDSPAAAFDRLSKPRAITTVDNAAQALEARKKAHPMINEVSKNIGARGYDAQKSWAQSKEERLAAIRRRDEKEARQHHTGRPMINPVSRQIAVNKDALDGMEGLNIEDRLLVRDHQHNQKLEEVRREKELEAKIRSNIADSLASEGLSPTSRGADGARSSKSRSRSKTNLTTVSTKSNAEEAGVRLFKDALARDARREEQMKRQELLECIDPKTGQILFQPVTKGSDLSSTLFLAAGGVGGVGCDDRRDTLPEPTVRFDYVHPTPLDDLAKPRPGRRVDEDDSKGDDEVTGKPKIGEYSRLLAQMKKAREEEKEALELGAPTYIQAKKKSQHFMNDFDRLAKPRIHKDPNIEFSFKPEINPNSEQIERLWQHHLHQDSTTDGGAGGPMSRIDGLLERKKQYDAHRERMRQQQEREEDLAIEKAQKKLMKEIGRDAGGARAKTPPPSARAKRFEQDSFVHRQNAWNAKRDAKLDKQRRGREEEELIANDCTFTPRLNPPTTTGNQHRASSPDAIVEEVSLVLARHCKKTPKKYSDTLARKY